MGRLGLKKSLCFCTSTCGQTRLATVETQEPLVGGGHLQMHLVELCPRFIKVTHLEQEGYISDLEDYFKYHSHHRKASHLEDW